jgi:hypothetical protein
VLQNRAAYHEQQEAFATTNTAMTEMDVLETLAACARCPKALLKDAVAMRKVNALQSRATFIRQ